MMNIKRLQITLYTIPQAACNQKMMNWNDVASLLKDQMENVYQDRVVFDHIEFMSPEWFSDTGAQSLLENGKVNFPFVLVNGEVACSERKVNISKIRRFAEAKIKSSDNQNTFNKI